MAKPKDLADWYAEQCEADPTLERWAAETLGRRLPQRKLPLLCDECLDEKFVEWLRDEPQIFKVFTLPRGRSDEHLWQEARQRRRLLVTVDRDFLDDNRYPLHESPGLLYLEAPTTTARIETFVRFLVAGSFLDIFSKIGWQVFQGTKSAVSPGHGQWRTHQPADGSVLVSVLWDQPLGNVRAPTRR